MVRPYGLLHWMARRWLTLAGGLLALCGGAFAASAVLTAAHPAPALDASVAVRRAAAEVMTLTNAPGPRTAPALSDVLADFNVAVQRLYTETEALLGPEAAPHLDMIDEIAVRIGEQASANPPLVPQVRASFRDLAVGLDTLSGVLTVADTRAADEVRDRVLAGIALGVAGGLLWGAGLRTGERSPARAATSLEELVRDLPDMVFESDAGGRLSFVSAAATDLIGRSPAELVGHRLADVLETMGAEGASRRPPEEWDADEYGVLRRDLRVRHPDGGERWVSATIRLSRDASGEVVAARGVLRDVSVQNAIEDALRSSEERFRTILEVSQDGILVLARDGRLTLFNTAICSLLGYQWEEMRELTVNDLLPEDMGPGVAAALATPLWLGEGQVSRDEWLRRRDGSSVPVSLSVSPFRERGEISGVLVEVHDLTDARRAEAAIERLAYFDRLTGLPNRAQFYRSLSRALTEARESSGRAAVLLFDLDNFRIVNDTLGHQAGDRLLREVAQRLSAGIERPHTLARLGGDEFMLVLPGIPAADDAAEVASTLLRVLDEPFSQGGHDLHVGASIGVSLFPDDGEDVDTLLRHADTAMYRAKGMGRNTYQFYKFAMDNQHSRLALEAALRRALQQGEFELFYQPLYDATGNAIVSVEALVRWRHPDRGLVAPGEFIPVMEETGLIVQLGEWALRTACAQAEAWRRDGHGRLRVAVNLSGRQFLQADLAPMVGRVLEETGLPATHLQLEVTESVAMAHAEAAAHVVEQLLAMGIGTMLDDFGTGHSSLSHLKQFPACGLKIDRSFVADLTRSAEDGAIVSGVIALGHALGLEVVAEGVETIEQCEMLRALGCDLLQGYFFSPALPAVEMEARLRAGRSQRPPELRLPDQQVA